MHRKVFRGRSPTIGRAASRFGCLDWRGTRRLRASEAPSEPPTAHAASDRDAGELALFTGTIPAAGWPRLLIGHSMAERSHFSACAGIPISSMRRSSRRRCSGSDRAHAAFLSSAASVPSHGLPASACASSRSRCLATRSRPLARAQPRLERSRTLPPAIRMVCGPRRAARRRTDLGWLDASLRLAASSPARSFFAVLTFRSASPAPD